MGVVMLVVFDNADGCNCCYLKHSLAISPEALYGGS